MSSVSSASSTAAPSASESVEPSSTSVPPSSSSVPPSSSSSVPPSSSSSSVPPSSSSSIPPSSSSSVPPSSSASSSSASASSSSASASSSSASASASSASASASATSSASSSSASSSDRSTSFSTSFTTEYVTDPNGQSSATSSAVSSAVASGNSNGGSRSSNNVGPIVGGVVGGLAGLALLAVLAWFLWKRNKKQKDQAFDEKMFDPAHRYSRGDPIDLVGGGANEPFTHGAGAAGGTIEPFPFTNPSSPQNTSHGLSHEGAYTGGPGSGSAHGDYFPQSNLNHRLSYPSMPMSMPDARDYAPGAGGSGAGWGYGGDGYATAAGMGAGAAAGAAGIGAFNNRSQAQQQGYHPQHSQQQGYSGYDYRSESTSQSGDSQYPPSSGAHGLGMTALTPAALAKQREATGGGRHQSHPSWGAASGPSGSALPYAQQQPQGLSSPTSPTADRRSSHLSEDHDSPGTNVNRQSGVYVHRDMDDLPEHAMPDELPPTYNANRSSQS